MIPIVTIDGHELQGILLPARADVVIRYLQIESMEITPGVSIPFLVIVARDLRWGGVPIVDRFEGKLLASAQANVTDCRGDLAEPRPWSTCMPLRPIGDTYRNEVTFEELQRLRATLVIDDAGAHH